MKGKTGKEPPVVKESGGMGMNAEIKAYIDKLFTEYRASLGGISQQGGVVIDGDLTVKGSVDIRSGRFYAMGEGGQARMILSGTSLQGDYGIAAHLAGFDTSGRPQFWIDADSGAGSFAGGAAKIDGDGYVMNGLRYGLIQRATGVNGDNPREARIEMEFDADNKPVLTMGFMDGTENANRVVNGDFATGDATGWLVDSHFSVETVGGKNYGKLTNPSGSNFYNVQQFHIEAEEGDFKITGTLWATGTPWALTLVYLDFLDADDHQLADYMITGQYQENVIPVTHFSRVVSAPEGTTQAYIRLACSNYAPATLYFGDLTLRKLNFYHRLTLSEAGLAVDGAVIS